MSKHAQIHHYPDTPLNIVGRPGPKSRGRLNNHMTLLFLMIWSSLLLQPCRAVQSTDTRVGGSPHLDPPGVLQQAAIRLQGSTNHNGVITSNEQRSGRKRAFLRTQKRAARSGGARYRGRWCSASDLGVEHVQRPPRTPTQKRSLTGKRFSFLSWNASGLTVDRHRELQSWLLEQEGSQIDWVAIQETHWKGQFEYNWDRCTAVHSGNNKSEAGLLLLVSKDRFPEHCVHYQEVLAGRTLHVRLLAEPCTDVILVYHYAWTIAKTREGKEARF